MKLRTLFILLVLFVFLASLAVLVTREPARPSAAGPQPGEKLLPDLDINRIEKARVESPQGTAEVQRVNGKWVVPSLFNYPADFDLVAKQLRTFDDLKVGQVVRGGLETPDEFGFSETNMTRILLAASGNVEDTTEIMVGAMRMTGQGSRFPNYPDGTYVRVGDGPIVLVKESLHSLPRSSDDWVRKSLFGIEPGRLSEITMVTTQETFTVKVPEPGKYAMDDLKKDEEVNGDVVARLASVLQSLFFNSIADPEGTDADYGFADSNQISAKTKDGVVYSLFIGAPVQGTGDRYARIKVDGGEGEEAAAKARELNSRFDGWTYTLGSYSWETLSMGKSQFVRKIPAKDEKQK